MNKDPEELNNELKSPNIESPDMEEDISEVNNDINVDEESSSEVQHTSSKGTGSQSSLNILELNKYNFSNKKDVKEFRLPKFFIGVFIASAILVIGSVCMFIFATIEVKKQNEERITLAGQNALINENIEKTKKEVVRLNTAGEIKDIWIPLIERRASVGKLLERILTITPNDIRIESIRFDLSRLNLSRITLNLTLGVVADEPETAGRKVQRMRSDLARFAQLTTDANETKVLGQVPVNYQNTDRQMYRSEEMWSFSIIPTSENELINLYNRLNRSHPINTATTTPNQATKK